MIRIGEAYAMDMGDMGRITERVAKIERGMEEHLHLERECGTLNDRVAALESKMQFIIGSPTVEAEPIPSPQGGIRISAELYDSLVADRRRLEWLISSSGTQLWDITGRSYRTRGEIDRMMKAGE